MIHLSDVFKFTQGLGQVGHQIGRKVGDAIELLTLGVINQDENLAQYLEIENGIEGATSAEHKVEFSFYKHNVWGIPSRIPEELFGIIECKKVGVEQTIKQNFKEWSARHRQHFHLTSGYDFSIRTPNSSWSLKIENEIVDDNNACITKTIGGNTEIHRFNCITGSQILIVLETNDQLNILSPTQNLAQIEGKINKCIIIEILEVDNNHNITKIKVNESLPGPQTPEKAKQASFVSLDVRKRVLGHFDKTEDKSFISILVIGEASHWEEKSRSMIRLCNDYNLCIPDEIIVYTFNKFLETFGDGYQDQITKTNYRTNSRVKALISEIIAHFHSEILYDMDSLGFVRFRKSIIKDKDRLLVEPLNVNGI